MNIFVKKLITLLLATYSTGILSMEPKELSPFQSGSIKELPKGFKNYICSFYIQLIQTELESYSENPFITNTPYLELSRTSVSVSDVKFSPDGRKIFVRYQNKEVDLWDAEEGKFICGFTECVNEVFSPDSRKFFIGFEDCAVLLNTKTGEFIREFEEVVDSAKFSPNGGQVFIHFKDDVSDLFDAKTGEPSLPWNFEDVDSVKFSPDNGKMVFIDYKSDAVDLLNTATNEFILEFKEGVDSVVFSPDDGKKVFIDYKNGAAVLLNTETGKPICECKKGAYSAEFSHPDGKRVFIKFGGGHCNTNADYPQAYRPPMYSAVLLNTETGETILEFEKFHSSLLSPDGSQIFIKFQDNVSFWNAETGGEFTSKFKNVRSVVYSPDHRQFFIKFKNGKSQLFDPKTGDPLLPWDLENVDLVEFSPDGKLIFTGFDDDKDKAILWNTQTRGLPIMDFKYVHSVKFSPDDGRKVFIEFKDGAGLWNTLTRRPICKNADADEFIRKFKSANSAVFSPDGREVFIKFKDGKASLWNAETGEFMMKFENVDSITFSPDGKTFAIEIAPQTWNKSIVFYKATIEIKNELSKKILVFKKQVENLLGEGTIYSVMSSIIQEKYVSEEG